MSYRDVGCTHWRTVNPRKPLHSHFPLRSLFGETNTHRYHTLKCYININIFLEYLTFIHCLRNKPGGFILFHLKQHKSTFYCELYKTLYLMSIILRVEYRFSTVKVPAFIFQDCLHKRSYWETVGHFKAHES